MEVYTYCQYTRFSGGIHILSMFNDKLPTGIGDGSNLRFYTELFFYNGTNGAFFSSIRFETTVNDAKWASEGNIVCVVTVTTTLFFC